MECRETISPESAAKVSVKVRTQNIFVSDDRYRCVADDMKEDQLISILYRTTATYALYFVYSAQTVLGIQKASSAVGSNPPSGNTKFVHGCHTGIHDIIQAVPR